MLRLLPDKFVFIRLIHQVGIFVGRWSVGLPLGTLILTSLPIIMLLYIYLLPYTDWRTTLLEQSELLLLLPNPSEVDVVVASFCSFAPRVGRCAPLIKSLGNEWICFVLITVVFFPPKTLLLRLLFLPC